MSPSILVQHNVFICHLRREHCTESCLNRGRPDRKSMAHREVPYNSVLIERARESISFSGISVWIRRGRTVTTSAGRGGNAWRAAATGRRFGEKNVGWAGFGVSVLTISVLAAAKEHLHSYFLSPSHLVHELTLYSVGNDRRRPPKNPTI